MSFWVDVTSQVTGNSRSSANSDAITFCRPRHQPPGASATNRTPKHRSPSRSERAAPALTGDRRHLIAELLGKALGMKVILPATAKSDRSGVNQQPGQSDLVAVDEGELARAWSIWWSGRCPALRLVSGEPPLLFAVAGCRQQVKLRRAGLGVRAIAHELVRSPVDGVGGTAT
jgi:hypothetical protein